MVPPVLIIAVGNESRGDDAVGPLLLRKLQDWVSDNDQLDKIELLEDFQLQVEHAADLLERELVLFVDAGMETPPPYRFYRATPTEGSTLFSHALAPEDVLTAYQQVYRQPPPPSFVLCISGKQFELGAAISERAKRHLELAGKFTHKLLRNSSEAEWSELTTSQPA